MSLLNRLQSLLFKGKDANEDEGKDANEDDKYSEIKAVLQHAASTLPIPQERLVEALRQVIDMGNVKHYVDQVERYLPLANGSLLDVGCHACWVAPFYLARGASLYHGIDLDVDPNTNEIRDLVDFHAETGIYNMPLSLSEYLSCFPNVRFQKGDILEFEHENNFFDNICMLNVTEHLMKPKETFVKVAGLMKDGGHIFITHHNFYCWGGHHISPTNLDQYDPNDPALAQLADWNHIFNIEFFDPKFPLNFIRIHELMELFKAHFQVLEFKKDPSPEERGGKRLTSEIRNALIEYYEDELLIELVTCLGKKPAINFKKTIDIGETIPILFNNTTVKDHKGYRLQIPFGLNPSDFKLFEDDRKLVELTGGTEADASEIREKGNGRYEIKPPLLFMSTSDNTDPFTNGRKYVFRRIKDS